MGKKIEVDCKICGNRVIRWKRYDKRIDKHFCKRHLLPFYKETIITENKTNPKRMEKNYHYKGITTRKDGYMRIMVESGNRQLYHRFLLQRHLGRKLKEYEIVHHLNGDPSDNRLENLQIMTQDEHAKYHKWGRWNKQH